MMLTVSLSRHSTRISKHTNGTQMQQSIERIRMIDAKCLPQMPTEIAVAKRSIQINYECFTH